MDIKDIKYLLPAGCSMLNLDDERYRAAIEEIFRGNSRITFITGAHRTGKTTLMKVAKLQYANNAYCLSASCNDALHFADDFMYAKPIARYKGLHHIGYKEGKEVIDRSTCLSSDYYWKEIGIVRDNKDISHGFEINKPLDPGFDYTFIESLIRCEVFMIDDVEALSADMFDFLMLQVCEASRQKGALIRTICFGDPLGLMCQEGFPALSNSRKPFYESRFWNECGVTPIVLKRTYGRWYDEDFVRARKEIRTHIPGAPFTETTDRVMRSLYGKEDPDDVVRLYPSWAQCDEVLKNLKETRYKKATEEVVCDKGCGPDKSDNFLENCLAREKDLIRLGIRIAKSEEDKKMPYSEFSTFVVGQKVLVTAGPYEGLCGRITEIEDGRSYFDTKRFIRLAREKAIHIGEVRLTAIMKYEVEDRHKFTEDHEYFKEELSFFPLLPADALTYDSVRGIKLRKVCLVTDGLETEGALYYGMTKVERSEDLFIEGNVEDLTKTDGPLRTSVEGRNLLDEYEEEM